MRASFLVTTPRRPTQDDHAAAHRIADMHDRPLVERAGLAVPKLLAQYDAQAALVVGVSELALWAAGVPRPLRFHGGMAVLRIRRMCAGERDPLENALGLRPGDAVLDATAGLLGDALAAAHLVGGEGRVVGIESSAPLAALLHEGLTRFSSEESALLGAMRRIELHAGDHATFLAKARSKSFDVVYFDPMFDTPTRAPPDFGVLRALADPRPLDDATLEQAVRVARRRVVVQDRRDATALRRLRLRVLEGSRHTAVRYGVIDLCT